jgi:hypothetical protein
VLIAVFFFRTAVGVEDNKTSQKCAVAVWAPTTVKNVGNNFSRKDRFTILPLQLTALC